MKDPTGPVFTLPKKVLQGSSEYLVRLYGRREKGIRGKTESVFLTNEVPMGGACFSSPTRGDALVTKFHIWCEGWKDPDMPLSYEFYYKNDEGKLVLFDYGFHNSTYSELPLGNPARDYTLEIYIKVLDFYKGAADYYLFLQVRIFLQGKRRKNEQPVTLFFGRLPSQNAKMVLKDGVPGFSKRKKLLFNKIK